MVTKEPKSNNSYQIERYKINAVNLIYLYIKTSLQSLALFTANRVLVPFQNRKHKVDEINKIMNN